MKIIVIGAVAAGTSAAAKARRNNDTAQITIYEKDGDISYSGCGLPYYIGGEIEEIDELTPRDAVFFKKKYDIDIHTGHEVLHIDPSKKQVEVRKLASGEVFTDQYDQLVIATGAKSFIPPITGIEKDHVFTLRNVQDARRIKAYIETKAPRSAAVLGTGFIGFEMLENLMHQKIHVTVIEKQNKITPHLDEDMAIYLEQELHKKGVVLKKNANVVEVKETQLVLEDESVIDAELVILATGVKPVTDLAVSAGVELGATKAIAVNAKMQTNVEDIYACGDCIQTFSSITGKPMYHPLGSTANKTGRIAGDSLTRGSLTYKGSLGTGIFKLFDLTIAKTGLSEKEALEEGYAITTCHNIKPDKPSYFNGKEMIIKAVADQNTQKLLGVQIIGKEGVDKRIDVFATLLTYGAKVEELFHLDLAYAPPFSTTKDPVHYTGMILDNALNHNRPLKTTHEVEKMLEENQTLQIVDARVEIQYDKAHVESATNMPHGALRKKMEQLDPSLPTVTYCNKGVTGNAAQNILLGNGFKEVYNLSGGHQFYEATHQRKDV
jgi:NADPH-dependent 2,4-dienoyl-CoA reductase/sulfur reductase-like enzyme/rhodanese-related sulfurtransferase